MAEVITALAEEFERRRTMAAIKRTMAENSNSLAARVAHELAFGRENRNPEGRVAPMPAGFVPLPAAVTEEAFRTGDPDGVLVREMAREKHARRHGPKRKRPRLRLVSS